jgi:hypothetical protein
MATLHYTDQSTPFAHSRAEARVQSDYVPHHLGSTLFLWIAWALAAAFWAATFTTAMGILQAVTSPTAGPAGGVDAGGIGFAMMDVIGGMVILGLALAYGMYRYTTRDKRMDPVTEASTAALYNNIERRGGDDESTLSPEAHTPAERDAYRNIGPSSTI